MSHKKFLAAAFSIGVLVTIFAMTETSRAPDSLLAVSFQDLRKILFPAVPEPQVTLIPTATPFREEVVAPPAVPSAESYEAQIVNVVERANESVVSITVTKNLPVIERYFENPFEEFGIALPPGFGIPQLRQKGFEQQDIGGGSGFVISSDGLILTNRHVVQDQAANYTVLMNDGSRLPADVVARDPGFDIAVLRVNRTGLKPLPLGNSDRVKLGAAAIAIGNALGEFRNTVSMGVISGLARSVQTSDDSGGEVLQNVIQTDAAINRGNSGGPLLNLRGEVIGVNTAVVAGAQNIGFAIPINQVKPAIEQVRKTGRIVVPFLGVRYALVTPRVKELGKLSVDYGALVQSGEGEEAVVSNSPAAKAGIRAGDVILEVNGEKVTQSNSLSFLLRQYQPGEIVTLRILREDQTLILKVTLAERQ